MDEIIVYLCNYASEAHWIILGLLLLAGFNVPLSEDLLILTAGIIASRCIPDQWLRLYIWVYFGSWISAWIPYSIGRIFGPKLYSIAWFKRILNPSRVQKLHEYYEKFGVFTFIVGRFFPGGVRNALFLTSGLGKMPFLVFILRDGVACLISTATLFYLGFTFGQNYEVLFKYFKAYEEIIIGMIAIGSCLGLIYWLRKKKNQ